MNLKPTSIISAFLLLFCSVSFAQNPLTVDPLTGAAHAAIPIYTVSSGQVSVPIGLTYYGRGVKPTDVEGTAGMNWNLQAGGQISRTVRGLPDDCSKDNTGATRLGWMSTSNTAIGYASTFTIQNNGGVTCSYETNDINNINNNIPYNQDTEPDLFYVSAPGLSCELVYDRANSKFHPVVYQDLIISYTTVGGSGNNATNIASFTITNDKGINYVFAAPESVTETTSGGPGNYFNTKYQQYQNGITYYDSWNLTGVYDPSGNGVTFTYTTASVRYSANPVILFIGGATTASTQYTILDAVTPQTLFTIGTTNVNSSATYFTFNWIPLGAGAGQTGQTVINTITGMGRDFQFNYSPVAYYDPGTGKNYIRSFLRNYLDPGCSTPINYNFAYNGETLNHSTGVYTTVLPDSSSTYVDYWGYYSSNATGGSLIPSVYVLNPTISTYPRYVIDASGSPGGDYEYALLATNNRLTTTTTVATGSLTKISYAQGGSTNIVYESNDYYDPIAGAVMEGGGVRVKQTIDSTGNTSASTNNIIRNYSYVNPTGVTNAGLSSGEPLTLPQFAFTIPYDGTATGQSLWTQATALSAYDLSEDDHTIMYAYCKVSQTGGGSTLYNFNVPSTYWSISNPTVNLMGRYTCSATYGPIQNYDYSYPFIPNPNYEFYRGQLLSSVDYNDAGNEVDETGYTYTPSYTPTAITAFKSDDEGPTGLIAKGYNRYTVNYNCSELTASVTKKVFDSNTQTASQSGTTNYYYNSLYHKLVTQQTATNSDNSIVNTYYWYIKDYSNAAAGSNANVNAIYYLQQENVNAPVETYQTITRGSTTLYTSGSLKLFAGFTPGSTTLYLPQQQLSFVQPSGVSSFNRYVIVGATPQSSTYDTRYYLPVANFDQYDNTGYPVTTDDNYKHYQTSQIDQVSNQPTVYFKNAQYNEVAFNDFDSHFATPSNTFTKSGTGSYTPVGSHAGNAAGLAASTQSFTSSTITKNTTAQNYIFSIWINATVAAGTLSFTGITSNPTISYNLGGWTYYEMKIPVANLASPTFTIAFSSSQNISIDDVLLYPEVASATTATYDPTAHYKIAQTNTNGVSNYFTNDTWGRTIFTFDQNYNIVQKNTFLTPADVASYYSPTISGASSVVNGQPAAFNIAGPDACAAAGTTVTWYYGDGTSANSTGLVSPSHVYPTFGTYTVTATVVSPIFGTFTPPGFTVTITPANVALSYTNNSTCPISSVVFVQGGVAVASFTGSQLNTANVPQGSYTVNVYIPTGTLYNSGTGTGFTCLDLNGSCTSGCSNYVYSKSGEYTFTLNLSACTTLNFNVSQQNNCSYYSGGGGD